MRNYPLSPRLLLTLGLALVLHGAGAAQGAPVGWGSFSFANPTGSGSAFLTARIHYPAQTAGAGAALQPRAGGHPVAVFLHGFAALGSFYTALADHLAAAGYVIVLGNTGQFSSTTQLRDSIAMFTALQIETTRPGGFFEGALDLDRAGVCGHSMGGGNTAAVLAQNPGFRAGFSLAPVRDGREGLVQVPLGILHGRGDTVVPWRTGESAYAATTNFTGAKIFYLLDNDADHTNITGLFTTTAAAQQVWARARDVLTGFFDAYVAGDPSGLEAAVGATARAEARLVRLDVEVERTELWRSGGTGLGQTSAFHVLAEPGPAALLVAAGTASLPTPFGSLLLDPATLSTVVAGTADPQRRFSALLPIPNAAALVGASVPFQGIGIDNAGGLELTGRTALAITP